VRYLAASLGAKGIRVNAISAGPIKTLAARGVSDFATILDAVTARAPLHRNIEQQEVGKVALFLASDLASGMTGGRDVRGLRVQYHRNLMHDSKELRDDHC